MLEKYAVPLAKQALSAITDQGLETGQKVLEDIAKGENVRDTLATHGATAAKNLVRKAGARLQQSGSGPRKKKKKMNPRSLANLKLVGRSVLESSLQRKPSNLGLFR